MNEKNIKEVFNEIEIPAEIDLFIEKGIRKAKAEKNNFWIIKWLAPVAVVTFFAFVAIKSGVGTPTVSVNALVKLQTVDNLKNLQDIINSRKDEGPLGVSKGVEFKNGLADRVSEESMATKSSSSDNSVAGNATTDYSGTNNQVQGVDEGDIVKTDGKFIYTVSENKLNIVEAYPADKMVIKSTISEDNNGNISNVFIYKDKLTIIYGVSRYNLNGKMAYDSIAPINNYSKVQIYDIKDKAKPTLLRTIEIDGYIYNGRLIENQLYVLSTKSVYPYYDYNMGTLKEGYLPEYKDSIKGDTKVTSSLKNITYFPEGAIDSFISINSINLDNIKDEMKTTTLLGSGQNIYCSTETMYLTNYVYDNKNSNNSKTIIYKISLKDGVAVATGKGEVLGIALNQFSMDEYNGNFRITTTLDGNNAKGQYVHLGNNLYILDGEMKTIGKIEGLAKDEKIYSTRFIGDKGYMVTYRDTDPLFVLDLKDPKNPKVAGELKIPGFSSYLHPYDENHLIGIGMDTEVVDNGYGNVAKTKGIKLSLFDVTDINNPKEMFKTTIGNRGAYSEALYNHKAFLFSREKNLLSIPVSESPENGKAEYFQGAYVYNIDLNKGFDLKGKLYQLNKSKDVSIYNKYNYINRILYIEDTLYSVSNELIKANSLNNLKDVSEIKLTK